MAKKTMKGLPVPGYRDQSPEAVEKVILLKQLEEQVLRVIDLLKDDGEVDQRWLSIGRTQIEQGFMATNRSIFQPGRVNLPTDEV